MVLSLFGLIPTPEIVNLQLNCEAFKERYFEKEEEKREDDTPGTIDPAAKASNTDTTANRQS